MQQFYNKKLNKLNFQFSSVFLWFSLLIKSEFEKKSFTLLKKKKKKKKKKVALYFSNTVNTKISLAQKYLLDVIVV